VQNDDQMIFAGTGNNRTFYTNLAAGVRELVKEESDLFQWEANPGGPDNTRDTDYATYSVFLEQRIGDNLNIEAAFNHLQTDFLEYDSGGNSYDLRGDTNNPSLNTGAINDHSGELFYETNWGIRTRDREADTFRLTASYELELPDNWGRHRFAAMYETMDSNSARESAFDQLADAQGNLYVPTPPGAATTNGQNQIWRRHYITPGDFSTYYVGSWKDPVSVTGTDGTVYTNQWFPNNQNVQDDDLGLDSILLSMQNFWFGGKLVTTYGYREDDITIDKRSPTTDPVNNRIVVDYDTPPQRFSYSGGTTTLGIVVKPTTWLSLLYNDSDNQGLPDVNRLVLPNSTFADPSVGEGKDYGIMLNLMDGRIFARVAHYESSMIGLTAFGNRGNVENPNNRILDTLLAAGLIDTTEREARDVITNTYTFGRDSEGYEYELTANITENWSLRFNYSETDRVQFNIMPEVLEWYPVQDAFWQTFGDTVYNNIGEAGPGTGLYTPPSGFTSIALESERIQTFLDNNTAFEGLGDQGSRHRNGNVFTNYRFTEGFLKGFNLGGGIRYLGPMSVTVDLANESLVWGNSKTLVDFLMGYRTKLTDKIDIKFQVNIRNLLDEDGYIIAGQELDGRISRIALQEPREVQFRTTLSW
jgi:iron complex outermembrane recepter protein